jgi:hypothetical protein
VRCCTQSWASKAKGLPLGGSLMKGKLMLQGWKNMGRFNGPSLQNLEPACLKLTVTISAAT